MSNRLAGTYSADRIVMTIGLPVLPLLNTVVAIPLPSGLSVPHTIDGRADSFLTVGREVPTNSKTTGVDGEVVIAESKNRSGAYALTLQVSSLSNTVLSTMLTLWESGVRFVFPFTVIDLDSPGTIFGSEETWIQGWGEGGFAAAPGTLTWNLDCAELTMFHGSRGLPG